MIENMNAGGMYGQLELGDFEGTGTPQGEGLGVSGYDAEGHLINPETKEPFDDPDAGMLAEVMGEAVARNTGAPEDQRAKNADEIRLDKLAAEINAITNHARVVLASAAIDIGKRLIEARGIVPHGRWTEWLAANVDYSERKAQQLMQLAEEFGRGQLPEAFSGLGLSQMTALLAAPEEAREALAEKAKDEDLSVRELQAEIARLKAESDEKQMEIDLQEEKVKTIGDRYDEAMQRIRDDAITAENAIEREREAARIAEAKAAAAESSANELRKLHSDAEDRAAQSAQRASDAVSRANRTAKELAEAKARIAELEEKGSGQQATGEPVERIVEVVPDDVKRELEELRRQLEAAKAAGDTSSGAGAPPTTGLKGMGTAVARFRDSYKRLTDEFKTAEGLIAEIARDDAKTGHMYATAMVKSCRMMIERLGEE